MLVFRQKWMQAMKKRKKEKKTEQGQNPSKMSYTESLEINVRYLYF